VLDKGPEVLRDVAMAANFGTQLFAITGFVGYNFGCMIASDTQFDSRGGFSGSRLSVKGSLPWQPILVLKLLLIGFVWTIVTRQLVMKGFEWSSTECRYCRYPALKGRCHNNPFLPFDGL